MLFNVISFVSGLWCVAYFPKLPAHILTISLCVLFIIIWYFSKRPKIKKYFKIAIFFSLGVSWGCYHAHQWLDHRVLPEAVGKNTLVTGRIISLPVEQGFSTRFLFKTEQFSNAFIQKKLQLSWRKPHPALHLGDRWTFNVRVKPPHGLVNPGGFNRLRWFWGQNIHGTGYVMTKEKTELLTNNTHRYSIEKARQCLQQLIHQTIPDQTIAGIISALTMGDSNGLTNADWEVLRRTGTVHLVVIAGLHMGLMAMMAYYLLNGFWRCFPALMLRYPAQQAGALGSIIFALGYGALAGFGVATQRAAIMIVILMGGQLLYRRVPMWKRLLIAFLIVIVCQPNALFSPGFWLSFSAVAWIAYGLSGQWTQVSRWRQWLRMQWVLSLGLMPLTLYFFHQFSLVSMIANLPAILWIGWLIVPLCLLAAITSLVSLSLSHILFSSAAYLLRPLWHGLQWLSAWPWASQHHDLHNVWVLLLALLSLAWFLSPKAIPGRFLGLLGLLPLWLITPSKPPLGAVWLTMLDVGQGLALVIQTQHHVLIYDTGVRVPMGFNAGRDVVLPYLETLGIHQVDLMMISHADNDHSGGAKAILAHWPIPRLLTSAPERFSQQGAESCLGGQQWDWDGVSFRVLAPEPNSHYRDNNLSCVLQIVGSRYRMLLTGDIEQAAEKTLVQKYGNQLHANVLVVPHHGSKTSSTLAFVKAVHPDYALFSLGYFNQFHFPAPIVMSRYDAVGARSLLTAQNGAITVQLPPNGPIILKLANPQAYFWQ